MSIVAVADTGPLIHLSEIGALSLLNGVKQLYVPETVYEELEAGGLPEDLSALDYVHVEADASRMEDRTLDPGETAAMAVAIERDAVLLTDDLEARETAVEAGIEVHGSVGVIALGKSRGLVNRDEAASLMRALQREASLFVTDVVIERGIELL